MYIFFNDIWINKFRNFLILKELRHKNKNLSIDYLSCRSILNKICSCLTNKNIDTFDIFKKKIKFVIIIQSQIFIQIK